MKQLSRLLLRITDGQCAALIKAIGQAVHSYFKLKSLGGQHADKFKNHTQRKLS